MNLNHRNFDNVVRSLRVLNSSACYRDHGIDESFEGYFGNFGNSRRSGFIENTAIGDKCKLSKDEVGRFKHFWVLLNETDKLGELSADRLSYVVERRNIEDKVLDCFIGLESLYLPDGNAELSFRLSLRIAKALEKTSKAQEDLFRFIRQMYSKRSKLAHGAIVEVQEEELTKLENVLRTSVQMYLDDRKNFNKDNLDSRFFKC